MTLKRLQIELAEAAEAGEAHVANDELLPDFEDVEEAASRRSRLVAALLSLLRVSHDPARCLFCRCATWPADAAVSVVIARGQGGKGGRGMAG